MSLVRNMKKSWFLNKTVSSDLELMYSRITDIHSEIIVKLDQMIEKASGDIKRNIINSMGGRPVDVEEMKQFLRLKVDKVEFNQLNGIKVDKIEFDLMTKIIEKLRSQLKNLAIIISNQMEIYIKENSNVSFISTFVSKILFHFLILIHE